MNIDMVAAAGSSLNLTCAFSASERRLNMQIVRAGGFLVTHR